MYPEKSFSAQSRCSVSSRLRAFFPPGLDPVLDRGPGDEDAMIPPEAPAGGLIRQAILDDQSDGRLDDPPGVVTARSGQIGHVGVEVLAAPGAEVLGIAQAKIDRPPRGAIPQVMEGPRDLTVAVGAVAASGAGTAAVVAAASEDLGLGEVVDAGDAFGGVGAIVSGSWQGDVLLVVRSLQGRYVGLDLPVRPRARYPS
jgi:hypothetical protein